MNLTVTPEATNALKKAVETRREQEGPDTIRVLVQGQCGCGSAHFAMGFDEPQAEDNQIDLGGVTLLVDPDSAPFLDNAEVECVEDQMMGQTRFKINAAGGGGCGCGGHH